jgi:hypothetical protein
MKPLLTLVAISGLTLGTAALSSSVLAQTPDPDQPPAAMAGSPPVDTGTAPPPASVTASRPVPDTAAASPGIPGPASVNPAPGAAGPYVGHGPHAFYDVDQRIADVTQRSAALPTAQRRDAEARLKAIRAEEATQKQRHGELRDWDRENLNYKLDQLAQKYPSLAGPNAQAAASNP